MTTTAARKYGRLLAHLAAALVLAACGAGDHADGRWVGTADTLPGGTVQVSNPATGVWDSSTAWRLVEELRIGSLEGAGPEVFGQIGDLSVDEYGRVYVLETQAREIRVFAAHGEHVRTIGEKGGGPGEFESPVGMEWDPQGRLWVVDPANARYSAFDTAGAFLTSYPRPIASHSVPWMGGVDTAGRLYDYLFVFGAAGSLVRFGPDLQPEDTFDLPYHRGERFEKTSVSKGGGISRIAASVPFTAVLEWLFDPRGYLWFGVSDAYRVYQRRLEGDTVRIIERQYEAVPLTSKDREDALERLKWFTSQGGEVDLSRLPDRKPAFADFFVDADGFLWVNPSVPAGEEHAPWDIFDPEGRYLGQIRPPFRLSSTPPPVVRGNLLYGVTRDELDVGYVVRARIAGKGGSS
ncbi:MAG: hypothetical protein HY703_03310 [Gemmatimonadetes bacterium]|nr:hypothetical protein [Gemmatimonadota bacterium]